MKKKAVWTSLLILTTIALLAAGTWHCLGWMMNDKMSHGQLAASRTWPKMLHLRADQQTALAPLEKKLMNDLAPIETELASQQMALCRLTMSAEAIDLKAISQRLAQVSELQKRKEERMVDHLIAVRRILTPEQQQELFTTLMTDICRGCRAATGNKKDHCGMCNLR